MSALPFKGDMISACFEGSGSKSWSTPELAIWSLSAVRLMTGGDKSGLAVVGKRGSAPPLPDSNKNNHLEE
jgi:hypothetical protein